MLIALRGGLRIRGSQLLKFKRQLLRLITLLLLAAVEVVQLKEVEVERVDLEPDQAFLLSVHHH
jgi:hypothetical protein